MTLTLLGLDTATEACSAALYAESAVAASQWERRERGHAERIVPMLLQVMADAGRDFAALDAVIVTVGPGSFTGVRVGLATARGLSLAGGVPVIGISTLAALAAAVPLAERGEGVVLAALAALPGQVYAQAFDAALAPLGPPLACDVVAAARLAGPRPARVVGTGAQAVLDAAADHEAPFTLSSASPWPSAATLVAHGAALIADSSIGELSRDPATPLYLKAPVLGGSAPPPTAAA